MVATSAQLGHGHEPLVIEGVEARVFEAPVPLTVSFGALQVRRMCLLSISAGGYIGRGESWVNWPAWVYAERLATLREGVAPLLVGEDALATDELVDRLAARLLPLGRQWGAPGPIWQALSAVDLALWDLAAQVAQLPLSDLVGPDPRTQVPVYASGIGPTDVSLLMERALEQGFTAGKLKVGFGAERDKAIIDEARSVGGDSFKFFADANRAWTFEEAKEMMGLLHDSGIVWCEEPLIDDEPAHFEELFDAGGLPLALGENVYGLELATRYMDCPGVKHLQPDVSKTGGITMARRFAERARTRATYITPHSYGSAFGVLASVQFSAGIPELGILELDVRDNPFRTDLLGSPLRIADGLLEVPRGVGLGAPIDEAALTSFEMRA